MVSHIVMKKIINSSVTLILMSIIVCFTVSIAIKQFFVLKDQVYLQAYYDGK